MDKKKQSVDLTEGVIWKQMLKFIWPILVSNVFNQLYSTTNSLVVGNYMDTEALSAVSASSSITTLTGYLFYGIGVASGILVSNYYGAKKQDELSESVHTSIVLSILGGVLIMVLFELLTPTLLTLSNVSESIYTEAEVYFRVYILGTVALFSYTINFFIMRSVGDSKHPLYYSIVSSIINLVLNIIFVGYLNFGVAGAALATVVAQVVTMILSLQALFKIDQSFKLDIRHLSLNMEMVTQLLKLGIPASVQNALIAFSNFTVQSYVNMFPNAVIAGIGVADKVAHWAQIPMTSVTTVVTSYVGQNLGAKKYSRVQEGIKFSNLISAGITAIFAIIVWFTAEPLVGLFDSDPEVIQYGATMVRFTVVSSVAISFSHVYNGSCRAAGNVLTPMIIAVGSQCILRFVYVTIAININFDVSVIYWSVVVSYVSAGLFATLYFRLSKWTKQAHLRA